MASNDTRDLAMQALTKINSHIDACERRYQEGNQRLEKMFAYIKDAHEKTGAQIDIIQNTLAEQRGAGKMAKVLGAAGAGIMGIIGGAGGSHLLK